MKLNLLLIFLLFLCSKAISSDIAGSYYWIQFKDKNNSPYSIEYPLEYLSQKSIDRRNRQQIAVDSTDFPVNPSYIQAIKDLGLYVKFTSRWHNGAIVIAPTHINIDTIQFPSFVTGCELRKPNGNNKSASLKFDLLSDSSPLDYGDSENQVAMMNGDLMHRFSQGEGVTIGILDAGFYNANIDITFDSLKNRNGILGTFDFVNPGNDVYKEHYHGTAVLSCITGNIPGKIIGTAPKANVWLLRSEDVNSEFPIEEDYWVIAAEFADSVGCDVINSSLGYSVFDDSTMNHSYDTFDGKTLRISQAANMAVNKGIVVTSSAGNEGSHEWQYIIAPADAQNVLGVAAVDYLEDLSNFSSLGFPYENFPLKPDVAAKGTSVSATKGNNTIRRLNGTSFSSPLMAGMAACLVKLEPNKTAHEIINIIRSLGDSYPNHSTGKGYGVPKFETYLKSSRYLNSTKNEFLPYLLNPAKNELTVQNISVINILNTSGQIIMRRNIISSQSVINLNNLSNGIYCVILEGKTQSYSFKFLKK